MTADELVRAIFKAQNELRPDDDPGDLTITIQDDMPLVEVNNDGIRQDLATLLGSSFGFSSVVGESIQETLEKALGMYGGESWS